MTSTSGRAFPESQARPTAKLLPRGDVLILGGDLAYPNPSTETYELRFFAPFEAALPPPPVSTISFCHILFKPRTHEHICELAMTGT